jgi:hypothetical protein
MSKRILFFFAAVLTFTATGCGEVKKWTTPAPGPDTRWVVVSGEREGKEPFQILIAPDKKYGYIVPPAHAKFFAALQEGDVVTMPWSYKGWKFAYMTDEELVSLYDGHKTAWESPNAVNFNPKFIYVETLTAIPSKAADSVKK